MKRAVLAVVGTVGGLVLLLGFKTHPATGSGSSAAAVPGTGPGTASAGTRTVTGATVETRWGPVQVEVTLDAGKITTARASRLPDDNPRAPEGAEILRRCAELTRVTKGCFSAYAGGVLDPSGLVKGWAVERASAMLRAAGCPRHSVGGGGDVQGGRAPEPGRPWRLGIADPVRPGRIAAVVTGEDLAVATSGTGERGVVFFVSRSGWAAAGL